jgi:3-dehydrotetronate 4-kinase
MRHHPLTPMTDANLVRVLQAQLDPARGRRRADRPPLRGPGCSGHRPAHRRPAQPPGVTLAIVDALGDGDHAPARPRRPDLPLVVAGSGLAIGMPALHGLEPDARAAQCRRRRRAGGGLGQLLGRDERAGGGLHRRRRRGSRARPAAVGRRARRGGRGPGLGRPRLAAGPVLVYATAAPDAVRAVQEQLGAERAGRWWSRRSRASPPAWWRAGVGRLIVAGGETSGACVQALGITQLRIGPQIDPGVPWCHAATPMRPAGLHLALKSGNFGGADFFHRAFERL